MTEAQKTLRDLLERQSKERGKMAELSKVDTLTDEQRAELDKIKTGTPDLERQIRAARVAVEDEEKAAQTKALDTPDAEMRERLELRGKASLGKFLTAALSGRQVDGAEAELQQAAGVGGIPVELWDTAKPVEQRADVATDVPGTTGINLDLIRPAVFAKSIAPRLGVEMPRVASGTYASATISTNLSAAAKAAGAAQESTAADFTTTTATPKRISARLSIQLEDVAAVGQDNFESALRENLSLALSDALDNQAINGDGQAPNLTGFFQRLVDPADPASVADFDEYAAAFADGVDGLWGETLKDIGIVVGPSTYQHASKVFQSANNYKGELSAAAYALANTGGLWTNKRMPDAAANIQQAILYRMGRSMMNGEGGMRTAVCPHWGDVGIDDIYSDAASGVRHFTLHVLVGDVILVQPDAYEQIAFKLA